jgi:quercetin dioxygenase-like cupin family protein
MEIKFVLRATRAAVAIALAAPATARERGETVTPHSARVIPNVPGRSLVAVVVDYAPGDASMPHARAKSAFIFYVVSGAIESQINDQPKRVYHAGESWYETPGSSICVSRNASATEPAKLLAIFVVDSEDNALTTPVNQDRAS